MTRRFKLAHLVIGVGLTARTPTFGLWFASQWPDGAVMPDSHAFSTGLVTPDLPANLRALADYMEGLIAADTDAHSAGPQVPA